MADGGDKHIIQRQSFLLDIESRDRCHAIQSEVSRIFHARLRDLIGQVLDEFDLKGQSIRFDRLEIDIGEVEEGQLEFELTKKIPSALRNLLIEQIAKIRMDRSPVEVESVQSAELSRLEMLRYFLETGHLSAMTPRDSLDPQQLLERVLKENPTQFIQLLKRIGKQEAILERLSAQFLPKQKQEIIQLLEPKITAKDNLPKLIQKLTQKVKLMGLSQSRKTKLIEMALLDLLINQQELSSSEQVIQKKVQEFVQNKYQSLSYELSAEADIRDMERSEDETTTADQEIPEDPVQVSLDLLDFLIKTGNPPWWQSQLTEKDPGKHLSQLIQHHQVEAKKWLSVLFTSQSSLAARKSTIQTLLKYVHVDRIEEIIRFQEPDFAGFALSIQIILERTFAAQYKRGINESKQFSWTVLLDYIMAKSSQSFAVDRAFRHSIREAAQLQSVELSDFIEKLQKEVSAALEQKQQRFFPFRRLLADPTLAQTALESQRELESGPDLKVSTDRTEAAQTQDGKVDEIPESEALKSQEDQDQDNIRVENVERDSIPDPVLDQPDLAEESSPDDPLAKTREVIGDIPTEIEDRISEDSVSRPEEEAQTPSKERPETLLEATHSQKEEEIQPPAESDTSQRADISETEKPKDSTETRPDTLTEKPSTAPDEPAKRDEEETLASERGAEPFVEPTAPKEKSQAAQPLETETKKGTTEEISPEKREKEETQSEKDRSKTAASDRSKPDPTEAPEFKSSDNEAARVDSVDSVQAKEKPPQKPPKSGSDGDAQPIQKKEEDRTEKPDSEQERTIEDPAQTDVGPELLPPTEKTASETTEIHKEQDSVMLPERDEIKGPDDDALSTTESQGPPPENYDVKDLKYFLDHGSLPPALESLDQPQFESWTLALIRQKPAEIRALLQDKPLYIYRNRIARTFGEKIQLQFIELLRPAPVLLKRYKQLNKALQGYNEAGEKEQQLLVEHVIFFILRPGKKKDSPQYIKSLVQYISRRLNRPQAQVVSMIEQAIDSSSRKDQQLLNYIKVLAKEIAQLPSPKRAKSQPKRPSASGPKRGTEENPIYINNAGIVLIWPFLGFYFKTLNLLDPLARNFKDEQASYRAAHLLQYLVSGKETHPEFQLVLNKILCGIPIETPMAYKIEMTEDEIELSEKLFEALKGRWDTLKTSSADGIRGSFLIREGRLVQKGENWYLRVEQKGYDMLLNSLPWAINMVRLPWMTAILHVEWR